MKKTGFTLIELLIASVVLAVLAAIAIPNYIRELKRARESEVKSVAHALQVAVEDYKTAPGWVGLKPATAGQLDYVKSSYLPGIIQIKRNPFNGTETYGTSAIIYAANPGAIGHVSYSYTIQTELYTISCMGGDPIIILTLVEGQ